MRKLRKTKKDLEMLLSLYDGFVEIEKKKFVEMLRDARARIVEGHKKYGNDWREKDNLDEVYPERLDIFNYKILDKCQKEVKRLGGEYK